MTNTNFDSSDILRSTDELSLATQHFQRVAGKTTDPDGIQAATFARAYGHGDIVDLIMDMRQFQMKTSEIKDFTEALNKAATQKEMIEFTGQQMRQGRDA